MNEWPVPSGRFHPGGEPVLVSHQPTKATERCDLARQFANQFRMATTNNNAVQLLVDDPELGDPFEKAFAPWPLRLYLIDSQGRLEWIAQPKDCSYDEAVQELMQRLGLW